MSQIRKVIYRIFSWLPFPRLEASSEKIDIVIPVVAKDLKILPLCLEGVRKCVAHNIKDIYIVAPNEKAIRSFCENNQLIFVDENTVFGYSPSELAFMTNDGCNRSGWLFQQLVKLSGTIGTCRYYLCIDSDHVLIRPHIFLTSKQETVFYMSYEKHQPYYDIINKLLPGLKLSVLSYVSHKMLFDKEQISKLHTALSMNNGGKIWSSVILDTIDHNISSGFSEFEMYGNFVSRKVLRPWKQKRLRYRKLADYSVLRKHYQAYRWSLTFPEYREK